jgi:putative AdoMet-dependent methyltransferase
MPPSSERQKLFENWASGYDALPRTEGEFPFDGYEQLLDTVCEQAHSSAGQLVLDLGCGTGNLAARLLKTGCTVYGVDFSAAMLKAARLKSPQIHFIKADLLLEWPEELPSHFDCIVSSYVLHEFDLATKMKMLLNMAGEHLQEGGELIVGDISFPTAEVRTEASKQWRERWDDDEYYWAADEVLALCPEGGLEASYTQVSSCAGVYQFSLSQ